MPYKNAPIERLKCLLSFRSNYLCIAHEGDLVEGLFLVAFNHKFYAQVPHLGARGAILNAHMDKGLGTTTGNHGSLLYWPGGLRGRSYLRELRHARILFAEAVPLVGTTFLAPAPHRRSGLHPIRPRRQKSSVSSTIGRSILFAINWPISEQNEPEILTKFTNWRNLHFIRAVLTDLALMAEF